MRKNASIDYLINIVDLGIKLHPDDPEFIVQKIELLCRATAMKKRLCQISRGLMLLIRFCKYVIYTEKKQVDVLYDLPFCREIEPQRKSASFFKYGKPSV